MATTAGIKAGKAFVVIEALDKTGAILGRISTKFKAWGKEIQNAGAGLLTKAVAAAVPIGLSLATYRDFDDALRKVEARSEGTAAEMQALRDQAKELGRTTAFTAAQVGNLQANLAQMGFNRKQIKDMTGGILNLALAGGEGQDPNLDAVNAAQLVSGTLRAFKMEASEAGKVADIMTEAMNKSNLTLSDMITALSYAGPIAKRFNVSLEDTTAVLGVMRNLNIDAESAGTAFRNMLLEMSDPKGRDKFNEMLKSMTGKEIKFTDMAGNLRPISTLLFEIGDAMKGMGTADQGNLLFTLFGKRAIVPAGALAEGKDQFLELAKALQNSGGAAARTAATMEAGIGGAWRRTLSAVEGVAIAIGEALAPMLTDLSHKIAAVLQSFTGWIMANKQTIITVTLLVAGAAALGVSLIGLGLSLRLLGSLLGVVSLGFTAITAVLRILQVGTLVHIAYLSAARVAWLAWNGVLLLTRGTLLTTQAAVVATSATLQTIPVAFGMIRAAVTATQAVLAALSATWAFLRGIQYSYYASVIAFNAALIASYVAKYGVIRLLQTAQLAYAATVATVTGAYRAMLGLLVAVKAAWLAGVVAVKAFTASLTLAKIAQLAWAAVVGITNGLIALATGLYYGLTASVGIFTGAVSVATAVLGGISSAIGLLLSPAGLVVAALAGIGVLLYVNRQTIFDFLQARMGSFLQSLGQVWAGIKGWFANLLTGGKEVAATLMTTFNGVTQALMLGDTALAWDIALDGLSLAWSQTVDTLMDAWEGFTGYFVEAWIGAVSSFKQAWTGAQKHISDGILSIAEQEGVLGDLMDLVLGVDVSEEKKRGIELERKRLEMLAKQGITATPQADPVTQAREDLRKEYDRRIDQIGEEAGRTLSDREKRIASEEAARQADIAERKAKLQGRLDELAKKMEADKNKAAEEAASKTADALAGLPDGLGDLVDGLQGAVSGLQLRANEGLEMGTVEAAKQAYENSFRNAQAEKDIPKKQLEALQAIDANLQRLELGIV